MTVTTQQLRVALQELIEQAAREDDGNFFSGCGVGIYGDTIRVNFADESGDKDMETFHLSRTRAAIRTWRLSTSPSPTQTGGRANMPTPFEVPRKDGRIVFPENAWRDDEETRRNLARIIDEDDEDAAREWYDERTPETMCLKIGRVPYPVTDLADASRVYQIVRNASGKGASTFPVGRVGEEYLISYNGRVWPKGEWKPGTKPILEATDLSKCMNCGEQYKRPTDCFGHCQHCIPDAIASTIRSITDLRAFQRAQGADV